MIEWLIKTRAWEWLFSGVGIVIAGWLFSKLLRKKPNELKPVSENKQDQINITSEKDVVFAKDQATINQTTIIQNLSKDDPQKIEILRTAYLNRVLEDTGMMPVQAIDPKALTCGIDKNENTCLNLSAVYTALLTHGSESEEKQDRKISPEHYEKKRLSALAVVNKCQRVVLLGDPGSGKTTFVNFLSMCMAGEGLKRSDINLDFLKSPLPDKDGNDEKEHQPWNHGFLIPVRVVLRDFASRGLPDSGREANADDLWQFITKELKEVSLNDYSDALRQELLDKGGLLMLDGLDEVPEAESKRIQIKQVAESFIKTFHKCRVLVTSRTYAYQKQDWRISGLEESVLSSFSDGQIRRFIDRWYVHIAELRKSNKEDSQGRAVLLKRAIFSKPSLRELAERPILLTLMASLHSWRGGNLPEKREELYADTVDLLLNHWEGPKVVRKSEGNQSIVQPSLIEWLKIDRTKMRRMLNELAFKAHSGQKELTGTADIAEADLVSGLMSLTENPEVNPRQLIEYLSHRAGLLVPRGVKVYSFPHRTFQEYLAACYLTDSGYPKKVSELCRNEPNRWREACLLAGAKAARGSSYAVWGLAENLCFRETIDPKAGVPDIWGAHIAGQALIETAITDEISEPDLPKKERIIRWLVKVLEENLLPAVERAIAGNTLSKLGDPRFNSEKYYLPNDENLGFVKIPAGEFLMGSDKNKDNDASEDEFPQHKVSLSEYWISKYPVTVGQFKAFLKDVGKEPNEGWKRYNEYDNHPVVYISWDDANEYCKWLTGKLKDRGWNITLPTEAQWEYAARGQDGRIYPWGDKADTDKMNCKDTGIGSTSTVGCFPKGTSPFGISDMSGNVWEWCLDRCERDKNYNIVTDTYKSGVVDPICKAGSGRVIRGGSWGGSARVCRSACRADGAPDYRNFGAGFRLFLRS